MTNQIPPNSPSARDVAEWMLSEVKRRGEFLQADATIGILQKFGESFIYYNGSGNQAISKVVLNKFTSISKDEVVWVAGLKYWRLRTAADPPGRKQDG